MNNELTDLMYQTLTIKTPAWPWPTTAHYQQIMKALAQLMKYELRSKHLFAAKPNVLGNHYETFERFDAEAISSLTADFYAEKIAGNSTKEHNEHHIIKWINDHPNQNIAPYLRNAMGWFIYELQCKANGEKCSIGIHLKRALQVLSAQGMIHAPHQTFKIFCFQDRASDECISQDKLQAVLLKTAAWSDIKKTILLEDSKLADQYLVQALQELAQQKIGCCYQKDFIDIIFQQTSFFQSSISLNADYENRDDGLENESEIVSASPFSLDDHTEESTSDTIESKLENEINLLTAISLDDLFNNLNEITKFINNQNWLAKVKEKCIAILQAIINDEGEKGVQIRVAQRLKMPPQSINDCMKRLATEPVRKILKNR